MYIFWWHNGTCGLLVTQPGTEPTPPALEGQSLKYWTTREISSKKKYFWGDYRRQIAGNQRWCVYWSRGNNVLLLSFSVVSNSSWPHDCSMPGFPVLHHLLELAQTHIQLVSDAIQPARPLLSPSPSFYLAQRESFPMSHLFSTSGQSIGVSTSASVLPVNIQHWFLLGLTGLIYLQAKGLSRVSSNTIVQNINSSQLSLHGPTLISIHVPQCVGYVNSR